MEPIIQVDNLAKHYRVYKKQEGLLASVRGLFNRKYRQVAAVDGVSFEIEKGEMVAFLGPNGAGKTTTLKLLSGLIYPTQGEATVLGFTPWQRKNEYRRRFSLVMGQKNQLWWDLPASESFRLHQQIYRIENSAYKQRIDELTSLLSVQKLIDQPVRELSLGERMRMELIASLLHQPEVLFLDEPTIGLDVVSQRAVHEFLKYYQTQRQITVILTSHYMKDVEALCQRAIFINGGRIQYDGPLSQIVDEFSADKVVTLQFRQEIPNDIGRFGEVVSKDDAGRLKIKVPRNAISSVLAEVFQDHQIDDISVQDQPLEDVIAVLFANQVETSDSEVQQGVSADV